MNRFEQALLDYLGATRLDKLTSVRVGIAGAGGLGSNCAALLVRSGFRRLRVFDFDKVEPSNLNRQFYFLDQVGRPKVEALVDNLKRINPDLQLEYSTKAITAENVATAFADCDIVIEALDKAEAKKLLAEAYMNSGKLYISASGLAGWGDSDDIRVNQIHDRFFLVGDLRSEAGKDLPPFAPRVNVAAAKEADVALSWVLGDMQGSLRHSAGCQSPETVRHVDNP